MSRRAALTSAPTHAILAVLRFYRMAISPIRPPVCRYTPSCSAYAVEAIERFGALRGGWLALRDDPAPLDPARRARPGARTRWQR